MGLPSLDGLGIEEFNAIVRAWNRAQNPDAKPELSDGEIDALATWMEI